LAPQATMIKILPSRFHDFEWWMDSMTTPSHPKFWKTESLIRLPPKKEERVCGAREPFP